MSLDSIRNIASIYRGAEAPTTGMFVVGDKIENTTPTLEKNISHWKCIIAGTPGVWVAYGCGIGTTAQRPTLTSNDAGYQYKDTTINAIMLWNGTEWV